jgi:hypothetical protein
MAFCELVGESERGRLFTEQAEHMPVGWPLSFFGCFRGRQDSPLRICGYLGTDEKDDCAADPSRIRAAFDNIGFSAYNRQMCTQIAEVFQIAPSAVDFQFDLYPDGRLGDVFAVDIAVPERSAFSLRKTFTDGPMAALMDHLKSRKLADGRVQLIRDSILVREVPVECDDDEEAGFLLSYRPKWIKIRWKSASMQQAKCYSLLEGRRIEGKDPEDMKRGTDI